MPTPNIELLGKVKDFVLANPEHFYMDSGLGGLVTGCGTTACIAGTACILGLPDPKSALESGNPWKLWKESLSLEEAKIAEQAKIAWEAVKKVATELLGITESQRELLFYDSGWELDYGERYMKASTSNERAAIAAQYIDYFIDTVLKKQEIVTT